MLDRGLNTDRIVRIELGLQNFVIQCFALCAGFGKQASHFVGQFAQRTLPFSDRGIVVYGQRSGGAGLQQFAACSGCPDHRFSRNDQTANASASNEIFVAPHFGKIASIAECLFFCRAGTQEA